MLTDSCMSYAVCLDVGKFDVTIQEGFDTICAAELFKNQAQPYCIYDLEIKGEEEIRNPVCDFVLDNVCKRFVI